MPHRGLRAFEFQMDAEVIVLDSDDEDNRNNASMNGGSALASIAIVNSKPLDLDALGKRRLCIVR